ncbi:hypothetical protein SynA1560_01771 [Synechococcus sp. A15-60]|nr:hypothetical protein SynA1560_01771 [Synechococcus sp. A15-60]
MTWLRVLRRLFDSIGLDCIKIIFFDGFICMGGERFLESSNSERRFSRCCQGRKQRRAAIATKSAKSEQMGCPDVLCPCPSLF